MSVEGHEVASRGLTSKSFPITPSNQIMAQVRQTSDILHNITGEQNIFFFPSPNFFLSLIFFRRF